MTELIRHYTNILQAAGLVAKEDGSVLKSDERYFVKGKPLMLPLPEVLRRGDVGEKLIFHPFAEAAAKGESDVLEDLRGRFALQLNITTAKLIAFFLQLGTGATKVTLDPEQLKVMAVVKSVGEKEARDLLSVIKATTKGDGKRTPLIKLYLSRRPNHAGKVKYYRTCVVTFPLYQAAKDELAQKTKDYNLLGVSINKKGLESLCRLMEFIFPGIDQDSEAYNQGSTSQIAPFADALFRGVGGIIATLNEKVDLYKDVSEVDALRMASSWLDVLDCMDDLFTEINRIPLQPNADGKARVSDVQTADLAVRPTAATAAPQQVTQPGQVNITSAPVMAPQYAAAPQAAATAEPEPEFIHTPQGLRRNPNFLRPAMVGGIGMGPVNKLDPYANGVMLPSNTAVLPPTNMYGNAAFAPNMYGMQQQQSVYGMQQQPMTMPGTGGMHRLPGLHI